MFKLFILFLLLLINMTSCAKYTQLYCQKLEATVNEPQVRKELENWFDDNFANKLISKSEYRYGGIYVPGLYTYLGTFDWSILGFDENSSRIKLLGIHDDDIDSEGFVKVNKVFLGERSRAGILLKSDKSESYVLGTDQQYIKEVTDRIAILCIDVGF